MKQLYNYNHQLKNLYLNNQITKPLYAWYYHLVNKAFHQVDFTSHDLNKDIRLLQDLASVSPKTMDLFKKVLNELQECNNKTYLMQVVDLVEWYNDL